MPVKLSFFSRPLIFTLIIGIFFYWCYLAFVTQPILAHDAQGYEALGRLIVEHGFQEYFITGPNREPLYPLLVAGSMLLGGVHGYTTYLVVAQLFLLFMTLILLYRLMRWMRIRRNIALSCVLYAGISPALLNSALSVYSEIGTYVLVLGIILWTVKSWEIVHSSSTWKSLFAGVFLGGLFVGIVLSKAIYEYIFPFYLIPFAVLAGAACKLRDSRRLRGVLIFLIAAILIVQGSLISYKYLNQKYNGVYALTDRGAWALYGNTARRQGPLTLKSFWAGLSFNVLERQGCDAVMGPDACLYWDLPTSDRLAEEKNYEVIRDFPPEQRNHQLLVATFAHILRNPIQYVVLTGFDWLHMFFWESARIGFVAYPDGLDNIYLRGLFHPILRMTGGVLSLVAFLIVGGIIARRLFQRKILTLPDVAVLFAWLFLFLHISFYALFSTIPRYALPVASLHLAMIALVCERIFHQNNDQEETA